MTQKKRKIRSVKWSALTWLVLFMSFLVFSVILYRFPLIPKKWKIIPILVIAVLVGILCYFSLRKKTNLNKYIVPLINTVLAVCLIVGSVVIPGIEGRIDEIFDDLPETDEMTVNVYALTTQYKTEHPDLFREKGVSMITDPDLTNYKNRQFITQSSVDQDNQAWAVEQIKDFFSTDSIWENRTESVWDAVRALYNAEGEALILNQAYVSTLEENSWPDFREETVILKSFTRADESSKSKVKLDTEEPFAVLIAGSDTREAALTTMTRTDVDIVAAVNPGKREILLVSLPRDTFIPNPALGGGLDKLTHMGIYGIDNTTEALSSFLDFELKNYVLVNFNTYERIIDTLGGVDIVNPYQFSAYGSTFPAGDIHLSGNEALSYVRERYSLPNGDFDRNEHQVIVLKALIRKILSAEVISNYSAVLDALSGTFLTNIATDSIYELASAQLESMSAWTINSRHIDGTLANAECASAPGELLSVVYPDENISETVRQEIKKALSSVSPDD